MVSKLSLEEARRLFLDRQMLLVEEHRNPETVIERLGYVQIDTLAVVRRSHHLTFWTRCPQYKLTDIDTLLKEFKIFEYWAHAAAYLPMNAYQPTLFEKAVRKEQEKHWFHKNRDIMKVVLDRIKSRGPLMKKDFKDMDEAQKAEWWGWSPSKKALEHLFFDGELMIPFRKKFHKVYDLPDRCLPAEFHSKPTDDTTYVRYLINSCISAFGFAHLGEINYLRKGIKGKIKSVLQEEVKKGRIIELKVGNLSHQYYSKAEYLDKIPKLPTKKNISLLSPWDNSIIQRERPNDLFGFEYKVEVYVPVKKRVYGYFVLPILFGDRFVARADIKADRKQKTLIVKSLHFENDYNPSKNFHDSLMRKLHSLKLFSDCTKLIIEEIYPEKNKKMFNIAPQ